MSGAQVLVYHDLLGMMQHPHYRKVTPKFCKQFGRVGGEIESALNAYQHEVKTRQFPGPQYSPYTIPGDLLPFTSLEPPPPPPPPPPTFCR